MFAYSIQGQYAGGEIESVLDVDGLSLQEVNSVHRAGLQAQLALTEISDDVADGVISKPASGTQKGEAVLLATVTKDGVKYWAQRTELPGLEPWEWVAIKALVGGALVGGVDRAIRKGKAKGKLK